MSKGAPLPTDVATLQQMLLRERQVVESLAETISEQQRKLLQQEHRLAQLLRQMYGPRSERFHPDQLTLFDAAELAAIVAETAQPASADIGKRRQKGHGRRPIPAGIPRETIAYELSAEDRQCPCCGELRSEIGRERSEQLEYVPPQYKVLVHERVKYACRRCQEQVVVAAKPPQPVAKGLPGPGLLAHTVLASMATTRLSIDKKTSTRGMGSSCCAARCATGLLPRPTWPNPCTGGCAGASWNRESSGPTIRP
jgi:hypothetical protein